MRNKINLLFLFCTFACLNGLAQPANDVCANAEAVVPDGTCYGGTTAGADDNWVGSVGCQSGNNNEVWYTFVATASQLDVTVTGGTMGDDIEFILVASTGACSGLTLTGSLCGPSVLTGSINGLLVGVTYYYTISSSGADGTFTTCVNNIDPPPVAGQDCPGSSILCTSGSLSFGSSTSGFGVQEVTTSNSCWGSGGERQSQWFRFSIGCSGTLEFIIDPNTPSNDYDFGLWDITGDPTGCTTKGNTVACDWSGCKGSTGLSSCPASEPNATNSGPGCGGTYAAINAPITVTAGVHYALLVDNFTTSNDGFSLIFGGACSGGTAVIGPDANFTWTLSADCMTLTTTKTCEIVPDANSTYFWNFGDGFTSTLQGPITHTYTTTGLFTVSLTVTDLLGCSTSFSETIDIGCIILPIELISFDGAYNSRNVDLSWRTSSEINNDFFTVEKSANGHDFTVLTEVNAAGNSTSSSSYSAIDPQPSIGVNYYRLKQTDFDGNYHYSKPISINVINNNETFRIFPNPAQHSVEVFFNSLSEDETEIKILDASGRVVFSQKLHPVKGKNRIDLNTEGFAKGVYFLTITNKFEVLGTKLVKE